MDWNNVFHWHVLHWIEIIFVLVVIVSTLIIWKVFSRNPKVKKEIAKVHEERQQISTPMRPISIPSDNSANSQNNNKANGNPKEIIS